MMDMLCFEWSAMSSWAPVIMVLIAWALFLVGIIGCVMPYPGHLFILAGCGIMAYSAGEPYPGILFWSVLVALALFGLFVDTICSLFGAKRYGCSRAAIWCSALGLFIGAFFFPIGIILGPFLGAFIAEICISRRSLTDSSKSGLGALLGALVGIAAKLVIAGVMISFFLIASR